MAPLGEPVTLAAYFARRMLLLVPTFVGVTFLVFAVTRFVPGGPIDRMLLELHGVAGGEVGGAARQSSVEIPPAVLAELKAHFGLDQPFPVAYAHWLGDLVTGDLGTSYKYNVPVLELITRRFPISLYFGSIGFVLAYVVSVPLGIAKAVRHGTRFDFATSAIVFVGYSIPGWALGALLLVLFGGGSFLDWVPLGGFRSSNWSELSFGAKVLDQLHHTILPVLAYAVTSFAALTILVKNSLLDVLGQDYVRTAYAKGLDDRRVLLVHALRNALIPLCTGLGHALSVLMAGSYLIERVFNIDGLGYLGYTSVIDRDYAVVMGILVFNTALGLLGNIVSDLLYVVVDPRVRLGA